jgi:transcriptional regulator with XRE-family HTH domain
VIRRALGKVMRAWREERGLSQQASGLGNVGHVSRIEGPGKNVGIKFLERLAERMKVPLEALMRDVRRMRDLIEHPEEVRSAEIQGELTSGGVLEMRGVGIIDSRNLEEFHRNFFRLGRRYGANKILIDSLRLDLTDQERYYAARDGVAMAKSLGYLPKVAMITDLDADRFGHGVVDDQGLPTGCFPTTRREDAVRWLQ